MSSNLGDQIERQIGGLLDRIPGYRGYRSKEDRRDADRRVRDHVVTAYTAEANRVARVAAQLADQRRLSEIGPVDDFAQALRHFIDRVRTATYGYGGLMGDRDVDATALDQLRLFDEGLLSGIDELQGPITDLEAALAGQGNLAAPARAGTAVVRALLARFDLRGEVVETGQAASRESVLRVLEPVAASATPAAYALSTGDALAILGDDFLVRGRILVDAGQSSFRLFQLSDEAGGEWLFAPLDPAVGLSRMTPVSAPAVGASPVIGGVTYARLLAGSGDGEIIGVGGSSGARPVRFETFGGADDPARVALMLDWGAERQAFAGRAVHPNDVEIFGRPSERLN
ncbi:MAG: hypothetical protein M3464_15135 [Chloroflexota bacterium]|nr:hypothetical protein [Chloroflexota bacterium]